MSRRELTLNPDYVPNWGIVEAVREIFQNGLDEEVSDKENKMFFEYNKDAKSIRVGNKKSVLSKNTLLLGSSTKRSDSSQIGQWGEGYKMALLVCMRLGYTFTVYNYTKKEIWRASIIDSKRFEGRLVVFDIEKVKFWEKVPEQSLIFEIVGVTEDDYKAIYDKNLTLQKQDKDLGKVYETENGTLLCGEEFKGNIYVSGLYVCHNKELDYGYDFKPNKIQLDRDRGLVDDFNLSNACSYVLSKIKDKHFLLKLVDSRDAKFLHYELRDESPVKAVATEVAKSFYRENGNRAVPVSSEEEAKVARSQDLQPIIVSDNKKAMITKSDYTPSFGMPARVKSAYEVLVDFVNGLSDRMTEEELEEKDAILKAVRNRLM